MLYKPSPSLYARLANSDSSRRCLSCALSRPHRQLRPSARASEPRTLRRAAPSMLAAERRAAATQCGGLDVRRHMRLGDVRAVTDRGFDRAAVQQNIFAIAPNQFAV